MYDIIHSAKYNVNGQLVSYIKTDRRGYGPTEVNLRYQPNGQYWTETIDLGYRYFWYCQNNKVPQGPFRIEDILRGMYNHLLTYSV
jgi:hypothetical protein